MKRIILCVVLLITVTLKNIAVALTPDREQKDIRFSSQKILSAETPFWVDLPPKKAGYHFFVGESHSDRKDEAMERAWISAFVRIGMTQFPELSRIKTESVETLRNADYKRQFAMSLEWVNWAGVSEAVEFGSPYVNKDAKTGEFIVYRLVKWADKDIDRARSQIKLAKQSSLPYPPEKIEQDVIDVVRRMRHVSASLKKKDNILSKVFSEVRCGVKIVDLKKVLGPPDWQSGSEPHTYRWGTFNIEADPRNTFVSLVIANNGLSVARNVCGR